VRNHPLFHRNISKIQEKWEFTYSLRSFYEINNKWETDLNCLSCESIRYSTERSPRYKEKREFTVFEIFLRNNWQRRNGFKLSFMQKHPLFHRKLSWRPGYKKKENSRSFNIFPWNKRQGETNLNCLSCESMRYSIGRSQGYMKREDFSQFFVCCNLPRTNCRNLNPPLFLQKLKTFYMEMR